VGRLFAPRCKQREAGAKKIARATTRKAMSGIHNYVTVPTGGGCPSVVRFRQRERA
jgi:hypothetical protein